MLYRIKSHSLIGLSIIQDNPAEMAETMDRFTAMRMFTQVVELRSFTKAAQALNVPKTTLSANLQELEALLRVKLLNRTTRQVSPTPDGAAYYKRVVHLLQELEEIETAVTHAVQSPQGRLRVDVAAGVARQIIMPALPSFFARYPEIQLELGCSDRPVDLLQEGVDCVVRGGAIDDLSLVARKIGEFQNISCASPDYLRRNGRPRTPADLERHIFVNYFSPKTGKMATYDYQKDGVRIVVEGLHQVAVNDGCAYVAGALAGLGLIQTARFAVQEHLDAGRLEVVLSDYHSDASLIYLLYPPNRHLSTKVRAFSDWIAELIEGINR